MRLWSKAVPQQIHGKAKPATATPSLPRFEIFQLVESAALSRILQERVVAIVKGMCHVLSAIPDFEYNKPQIFQSSDIVFIFNQICVLFIGYSCSFMV